MYVERLSEKSYRVRKSINSRKYTLLFDHKPSEREVNKRLAEAIQDDDGFIGKGSFLEYANKYIDERRNVLSPSSILTYERMVRNLSSDLSGCPIDKVDQSIIQEEINKYAENHAPKTVRSLHGFISAILAEYRPKLVLRTTLPQKEVKAVYCPSRHDISRILEMAKGTEDSIPFQLGILSLRRSEVCALDMSDLQGNELWIHRNMVYYKGWQVKECGKTDASNRTIVLPDSLVKEITDQGYFFKYTPPKLLEHLRKYQKALDIPEFRFHDLRHYFASYASTFMPEADVMALGGWKSDYVFKQIYRESMDEQRKKSAKEYINRMFGNYGVQ